MTIGVDTNILQRHTLQDDAAQSPAASKLLEATRPDIDSILVNPVVLLEFVWTLSRRESFKKTRILALLDVLASSRRIVLTDRDAVTFAIEQWRRGGAQFQDYLIGALNTHAGAKMTLTFDRVAARQAGFSLLKS